MLPWGKKLGWRQLNVGEESPGADSIGLNDSRRGCRQSILNTQQPLHVPYPLASGALNKRFWQFVYIPVEVLLTCLTNSFFRMVRNSGIEETETSNQIQSDKNSEENDSWISNTTPSIADFGCSDYWGWSKKHRSPEVEFKIFVWN